MAAARIWNNAEGGSNTTTVTTANSGGNSGIKWQVVTIGTSSTLTYDNTHVAHGALAYKFVNAAATNSFVEWTTNFGTQTTFWGRVYLYITANPSNNITIFNAATTGTQRCGIVLDTNGKLNIADSAGGLTAIGTAVSTGAWVRVEFTFTINASTGSATINLYNTPNSFTSTDTVSVASKNFGGTTATQWNFGIVNSPTNSQTLWIDSINLNTDGFPGPDFLEQTATVSTSVANPITLAFPNNNTAGNMIVVSLSSGNSSSTGDFTNPTDTAGNSYIQIYNSRDSSLSGILGMWYAYNIKSGANTVSVANSNTDDVSVIIREYSGVTTSDPLDQTATVNIGAANPLVSNSTSTTSQAQEIIIGVYTDEWGSTNGDAAAANYNNFISSTVSASAYLAAQMDRIVDAIGTYNFSLTVTNNSGFLAGVATFKLASGVVPSSITYIPARIPNSYVGPMALRHNFRSPYLPEPIVNAPLTGWSAGLFGGKYFANAYFGDAWGSGAGIIDDLLISVSDAVTVSENLVTLISNLLINQSDSTISSESIKLLVTSFIQVSDSSTTSESINIVKVDIFNVSDSTTTSESVQLLVTSFINTSDSTTTSENTNIAEADQINVNDAITTSESLATALALLITVSDSTTTSENVVIVSDENPKTSDSITTSENVVIVIPILFINTSDSSSTSESIMLLDTDGIGVLDTTVTSENVQLLITNFISTFDSITTSENIKPEVNNFISISDNTVTSENMVIQAGGFGNATASDSTITSENVQLLTTSFINVNDNSTTSENISLLLINFINTSDSTTTSESIQRLLQSFIRTSDSITTSESIQFFENIIDLAAADSMQTSENVIINAPTLFTRTETLTMIVIHPNLTLTVPVITIDMVVE